MDTREVLKAPPWAVRLLTPLIARLPKDGIPAEASVAVWALLVLLALKIGLDLKAHVKEHSIAKP